MKYILLILTTFLLFSCNRDTPVSVQGSSLTLDFQNGMRNSKSRGVDWPDNFTAQLTISGNGMTTKTLDLNIVKQVINKDSAVYRASEPVEVPAGTAFGIKITAVIKSVIWEFKKDSVTINTSSSIVIPVVLIPNAATPVITTTPGNIAFGNVIVGNSQDSTFTLIGNNLRERISLSVPLNSGYKISMSWGVGFTDTLSFSTDSGMVNAKVYVKFTPSEVKDFSAEITCSSAGAETQFVTLTGAGIPIPPNPSIDVTLDSMAFGNVAVGIDSTLLFRFVARNLTENVTVTAPSGFTISKIWNTGFANTLNYTPTSGNIDTTTVFVRFSPKAVQVYGGNVSLTSAGLATRNVAVTGTGATVGPVPEMILVNGGTFQMGDSANAPVHSVTLSSFYIGKYELTQAEWVATMGSDPIYQIRWYHAIVYCNKRSIAENLTPCYTIGGSTNPDSWGSVPTGNNSSTWDAVTCNWSTNGYRLPTEAEWEFAARGGNNSKSYLYSGSNFIDDVAWYTGNSTGSHFGGTKAPNELGIYDMSGNLEEWTWDWYGNYSAVAQTNPHGASIFNKRVVRGGGYNTNDRDCRVANRSFEYPSGTWFTSFRLAKSY